jgi:hypothetical protein
LFCCFPDNRIIKQTTKQILQSSFRCVLLPFEFLDETFRERLNVVQVIDHQLEARISVQWHWDGHWDEHWDEHWFIYHEDGLYHSRWLTNSVDAELQLFSLKVFTKARFVYDALPGIVIHAHFGTLVLALLPHSPLLRFVVGFGAPVDAGLESVIPVSETKSSVERLPLEKCFNQAKHPQHALQQDVRGYETAGFRTIG